MSQVAGMAADRDVESSQSELCACKESERLSCMAKLQTRGASAVAGLAYLGAIVKSLVRSLSSGEGVEGRACPLSGSA